MTKARQQEHDIYNLVWYALMSPAEGKDYVIKNESVLDWLNAIERMGRRLSAYELGLIKLGCTAYPEIDERPMKEIMVEKGQPDWGKPRKSA